MDKLRKIINCRLSGSSLIEVITAIVIISMVFTTAIIIYLNVMRSGTSSNKLAGELVINEVISKVIRERRFEEKKMELDGFMIYLETSSYQNDQNLKLLIIEARNLNGKVIAEKKRLIYVPG